MTDVSCMKLGQKPRYLGAFNTGHGNMAIWQASNFNGRTGMFDGDSIIAFPNRSVAKAFFRVQVNTFGSSASMQVFFADGKEYLPPNTDPVEIYEAHLTKRGTFRIEVIR